VKFAASRRGYGNARSARNARLAGIAGIAAVGLLVAACGGSTTTTSPGGSSSSGPLKLGFMGALTGPDAQLGINIYNGAELAVKQHNAKSGVTQVQLVKFDTQGDPAQATSLAPKAISSGVVGIIGPAFSGESKTADPIFEQAKIPNISPSATNPGLSQNGWKYFHRVLANDDAQGPGIADFLSKQAGAKNIAVIDDASAYGKGLADVVAKTLTSGGVKIANRQAIDPKANDYASTVNAIKAANADAVFFGGYYSAAARFVKQLRDAGSKAMFASGDGTLDQKFITGAGNAAAQGAFVSCTCALTTASTDPTVVKFNTDYKAAYGSDPATYSAEGFDAATAFLKAIDAGKRTGADINAYLATEDFTGVSKPIKFTSTGELAGGGSVFIYEVVNGAFKSLGDFKTAKPVA